MASKPAPPSLAERSDIHKSCKSLETLLNIFNDYCEAAGATAILQKKLAKALRETASMRTTGEIAANAMIASATIFEVSSDIDSKFVKVVDKEYDTISAEVKKWFKKLAKEEKIHDERIANANTKIKQAGQVYEKKTKKNPRDTTEEHNRYINVISTLGPEISQEKYNHALHVTQRHATTTYGAAACFSRVADAEWLKTCEGVRRYAPTIGNLGEWRALCEGGWSESIPPDLVDPNIDEPQQPQIKTNVALEKHWDSENIDLRVPPTPRNFEGKDSYEFSQPSTGRSSRADPEPPQDSPTRQIPAALSPSNAKISSDTQATIFTAPSTYDAPPINETNVDSVRSLSAFPLPPTHFPIPPPRQRQASQSQSSQSAASYPSIPRLTESPLPVDHDDAVKQLAAPSPSEDGSTLNLAAHPSTEQKSQEKPPPPSSSRGIPEDHPIKQPLPVRSQTSPPGVNFNQRYSVQDDRHHQQNHENTNEFGVNANHVSRLPSPEVDKSSTSGSLVAAMRNRYIDKAVAESGNVSPPRIVHRASASGNVSDLAGLYQPAEIPSSPRLRSPSVSRHLPIPPNGSPRATPGDHLQDGPVSRNFNPSTSSPRQEEAARRRQQRLNDLAQLELKEKELALSEREHLQQRELDRGDRVPLAYERQTDDHPRSPAPPQSYPQLKPREKRTSFRMQRPQSQLDLGDVYVPSSGSDQMQLRYSHSTSNLVPPSPSSNSGQYSHGGQSRYQSHSSHASQHSHPPTSSTQPPRSAPNSSHAPYCGCEACSATKYSKPQTPLNPASLRPPAEPISLRPPEKKSGWMRRLSMPVGNAFSLDSKKGGPLNFTGVGSGQGRTGFLSMDGKKNASSTQLNVHEDGRRSYDASGTSNRSMTNLSLGIGRR